MPALLLRLRCVHLAARPDGSTGSPQGRTVRRQMESRVDIKMGDRKTGTSFHFSVSYFSVGRLYSCSAPAIRGIRDNLWLLFCCLRLRLFVRSCFPAFLILLVRRGCARGAGKPRPQTRALLRLVYLAARPVASPYRPLRSLRCLLFLFSCFAPLRPSVASVQIRGRFSEPLPCGKKGVSSAERELLL